MDNLSAERKKPGLAFWATVVLFAVLAYPLSWAPAYVLWFKLGKPEWMLPSIQFVYWPLDSTFQLGKDCPAWFWYSAYWYLERWAEIANLSG